MESTEEKGRFRIEPLTHSRWHDFEKLFGERGACGGCWCMWWRLKRSEFNLQKGEGNKEAMRRLVESGRVPGLLAYDKSEPVGWISVAPREEFQALERSRILKPVDDNAVWSVVCFFVDKHYRGKGITVRLLEGAKEYVRRNGGAILEGYPVDPENERSPDVFVYTGLANAFKKAGFSEVARRSKTRPIMRYELS